MTDEITRLAQEADDYADQKLGKGEFHSDWHDCRDEYFALLIAMREREECAKTCIDTGARMGSTDAHFEMADRCAEAIRERVEP